jgi:hypothetical protein
MHGWKAHMICAYRLSNLSRHFSRYFIPFLNHHITAINSINDLEVHSDQKLCAPDDYSIKNMQKYFKQFSHLPWPTQNTFGMWTVLYWTQSSRKQLSMSINVWRLLLLSVGLAESRLAHCSLSRLIVLNHVLVPPFISRGTPSQTAWETSISERRKYKQEMAGQI